MPQTSQEIAQSIITQIQLQDPAISAEDGTPERKIIDAVAESIAAAQVDFSVLDNQFDLSTMSGGTLDAYLGNFGFTRQQGVAASGTVTFSRSTPATADILIPQGAQLTASVPNSSISSLVFVTVSSATLATGTTSVDVQVQATTPGTAGNIPALSVTGFAGLQSIAGISSVLNADPMTGGVDLETDADLKTRFQNTVFRNMAGTYDQFMALAVGATSVSKANVIGPISRYQEYVQVPSSNDAGQKSIVITDNNHTYSSAVGGYDSAGSNWAHKRTTVGSKIPYAQYVYDNQFYVTDGGLGQQANFLKPFVDFVFNRVPLNPSVASSGAQTIQSTWAAANQPNFTFLSISGVDSGANPLVTANAVLLTEFAYISSSSRNNYYKGITNAIDIFVNGTNPQSVNSQEVMPGGVNQIQSGDSTKWTYQSHFARVVDGRAPSVNNKVLPMFWQPVSALPNSIQLSDGTSTFTAYLGNYYRVSNNTYYNKYDGTTYSVPANYLLVKEVKGANNSPGYYGTVRARNGIEFLSANNLYKADGVTVASKPATDSSFVGNQFTINNYAYDKNISDLQAVMESNKQIGTDVLVHQAYFRYFVPYVNVMYTAGSTISVVNASIAASLASFYNNQFYGAAIQLSDILSVIHDTAGVDNVEWSMDGSNPSASHRIQETFADGTPFDVPVYWDADFYIQDNQLAASPSATPIVITPRVAGTW